MKVKVTEVFYSLQGEGVYVGTPSVFVRLWGCNLECNGFSNSFNKDIDIIPALNLDDINMEQFKVGCDSRYSWHKSFSNLSETITVNELLDKIMEVLPDRKWITDTGHPIHLVVTGGEPTLHQRQLVELLAEMDFRFQHNPDHGLQYLTIETNATVPLKVEFLSGLRRWVTSPDYRDRTLLWSNSPKLMFSGETRENAIKADVIKSQLSIPAEFSFKFVVRPIESDFKEVQDTLDHFIFAVGKPDLFNRMSIPLYVMPVGASSSQQDSNLLLTAELCLKYGYRLSGRLHAHIFGNTTGT